MGHWAKPPVDPDQPELLGAPLRRRLPQDHPVHLFDEILGQCDWSPWENEYVRVEGQPPIHPRYVAGPMTYGLTLGVRSTRALEERLAAVDQQVAELLARADEEDREEDTLFGKEASPHHLSRELANVQRRQEALAQALANARAREAKRQPKKGSSAKAKRSRP